MVVTAVAVSRNIGSAALNLNTKAAELRQVLVGMWELADTSDEPPPPESVESHDMLLEKLEEGVIGDDDGRILVEPKHFGPGGKYRSIVKILTHHEFQKPGSWMLGTGWLIRPDLLVTAGHCVYDWGHQFGRVTELKAYIGYDGAHNINNPNVQFRHGKKIVCPEGWLRNKGAKPRDVGFVQLDKPFTGVSPIAFRNTDAKGQGILGVVGYPADKYDKNTHEKGAHMYEMFEQTTWDLTENDDTMLQYKIDTFGGNSGSPVLIQGQNTSIGAHVYGGSVDSFNSASVIGPLGNQYQEAIRAFDIAIPKGGALHLKVIPSISSQQTVPQKLGSRSIVPAPKRIPLPYPQQGVVNMTHDSEEGFIDILRGAIKIGAPALGSALQTGLPIVLGPLGGPIGALASIALGKASKMAESSSMEGAESTDNEADGVVERAILADAALNTLVNINLSHDEEESIFSDMKDMVLKALPSVKKAAGRVLPAMMEPALRIALDSLNKKNQGAGAEGFDSSLEGFTPAAPYPGWIDSPSKDRQSELFLNGLLMAAAPPGAESGEMEEGFIDFLKIGLRAGTSILKPAIETGLPIIAKLLTESEEAEGAEVTPSIAGLSTDALAKRAVVAEAALQALTKLPPQRLQEEGFFDQIVSTVKKYGPAVMRVAPAVLDNVSPIAGGLLRSVFRQEASIAGSDDQFDGNVLHPALARTRLGEPRVRKQRSQVLPRGQPPASFLDRANRFN